MLLPFALLLVILQSTVSEEHKVHNIVLYPEKHSWCQTTPIQQVVASSGYESITIDNNVCVGACYSYSIPKTQPAEPGEEIGPYCDSCQPLETKCYHVTLQADEKNTDGPKTLQKRVQIILNCTCMSCEKIHRKDCDESDENTVELPMNLFSNLNRSEEVIMTTEINTQKIEEPDLLQLDIINRNNITRAHAKFDHHERKYELKDHVLKLLKSIQNDDLKHDKNDLKNLIKLIQGEDKQLNDKNLVEFVNFVNVNNPDDFEVDINKLKDVLTNFQKSSSYNDHSNLERGSQNNVNIERDLKRLAESNFILGKTFGAEGSRPKTHFKGNHYGMGIENINADAKQHPKHNVIVIDDSDEDEDDEEEESDLLITTPKTINSHPSSSHFIGEVQHMVSGNGHLVSGGPHGSMIVIPDTQLKPNHEGVVVSYETHNNNNNNRN